MASTATIASTRDKTVRAFAVFSFIFYVAVLAGSVFFYVSLWGSDVHTRHSFDVGGVSVSTVNAMCGYGVLMSALGLSSASRAYRTRKVDLWVVLSAVAVCMLLSVFLWALFTW